MSWWAEMGRPMNGLACKRALDVAGSGAGLAILSPLLIAVAVANARTHGWPPFFLQSRPGFRGRSFTLVKFRSMTDGRDANGNHLPDEDRLTDFGAWLRATSIDELPELWNVLRGEMSLVGPRPLLQRYLERYDARQARRHEMPPGITGLAQVRGRNLTGWLTRLEQDVLYVETWSFWLDVQILLDTLAVVARREGIAEAGEATRSEFMGPEQDASAGAS